jgi:hypothetical protein
MREVVRSDTLAQLEEFRVEEQYRLGGLTVEALEMLIQHCSHFKSIQYLGPCCSLEENLSAELQRPLGVQDIDLQIM